VGYGRTRSRALLVGVSALLLFQVGYAPPVVVGADPSPAASAPAPSVSPSTPPPAPETSPAPAAPEIVATPAAPVDVVSLRTATSDTIDNGDGTFTTNLYSDPVYYKPTGKTA
jgi:hypothetical protein